MLFGAFIMLGLIVLFVIGAWVGYGLRRAEEPLDHE